MQKKSYTPPTVTEHGNVVEETKGVGGWSWEPIGEFLGRPPAEDGRGFKTMESKNQK